MRRCFLQFFFLLIPLLLGGCGVPDQSPSSGPSSSFVTEPCDGRPDGQIFREHSETSHGVDQQVLDWLQGLGHLLLFLWWLFAASVLAVLIAVFQRSVAVWIVMWVPFLLVASVAVLPLQKLRRQLADLQQFQEQCRTYDPPSQAFLTYKQHRWDDATPYMLIVTAITFLYVPAILTVIRAQRNKLV